MVKIHVGIAGVGFVGNAVYQALKKRDVSLVLYDKYKNVGCLKDLLDCDAIFVCVPTPLSEKGYDLSALTEICTFLSNQNFRGVILVKSTVLPGTCEELAKTFDLSILNNPEFLTARTAVEDFDQQKHIVLGVTSKMCHDQTDMITEFYREYFPAATISCVGSGESEAMKVFCNSFYAVKIQIFNEFYLLSEKLGIDYMIIRQLMLGNGWINPQHTTVPGPDGNLSYGGMCFPKDTRALLALMKENRTSHQVLDACIAEQAIMRDS